MKTICPVRASAAEGAGIDRCPEDNVGFGEGRFGTGVAIASGAAGDESEEGVEACSVANRSGVGVDTELRKLHPRMKLSVMIVHSNLDLFTIQFD